MRYFFYNALLLGSCCLSNSLFKSLLGTFLPLRPSLQDPLELVQALTEGLDRGRSVRPVGISVRRSVGIVVARVQVELVHGGDRMAVAVSVEGLRSVFLGRGVVVAVLLVGGVRRGWARVGDQGFAQFDEGSRVAGIEGVAAEAVRDAEGFGVVFGGGGVGGDVVVVRGFDGVVGGLVFGGFGVERDFGFDELVELFFAGLVLLVAVDVGEGLGFTGSVVLVGSELEGAPGKDLHEFGGVLVFVLEVVYDGLFAEDDQFVAAAGSAVIVAVALLEDLFGAGLLALELDVLGGGRYPPFVLDLLLGDGGSALQDHFSVVGHLVGEVHRVAFGAEFGALEGWRTSWGFDEAVTGGDDYGGWG